jgi:tetratricopeptide (TPR) repeat protein
MKQEIVSQLSIYQPAIDQFSRFVKKTFLGQALATIALVFFLLIALVSCFCGKDFLVAVATAISIASAFLFYLLRLYIKEQVIRQSLSTKQSIEETAAPFSLDTEELADLFSRLALSVRFLPSYLITWPAPFASLANLANRMLTFLAWQPLHTLAEVLFLSALDAHISRIKSEPTNLHYHASLANCYVMLSTHYLEPIKSKPLLPAPSIFISQKTADTLNAKARASSTSAIEELSILSCFAPDQLWVHDQLAISYRELEMPEKEIEECENIIRLSPDDHQALLRVGILYFKQGKNAKGLEVYERLKQIQPLLADELIGHYGAYKPILEPLTNLS